MCGLQSSTIHRRLLEKLSLTLDEDLNIAHTLESTQQQSLSIYLPHLPINSVGPLRSQDPIPDSSEPVKFSDSTIAVLNPNCFSCGNTNNLRIKCTVRNVTYYSCGKSRHFAKVCNSVYIFAFPNSLERSTVQASIDGKQVFALVDTGSSLSFIHATAAQELNLHILPY
ncbi:hypothetical protein PR048_021887 [Dryococelus australis]|uniref:Uncharacterized protein n=1 Tax=Dryococelus australis TaxID=614101 RepID=A0ABQ9GZN1_9NEOP|nr:hypothetical protein PR048_021887 [Dryococelus australis]